MHRYEDARRYQLSLRNVTLGLPSINARFFRRAVFEKIGDFNLDYPIAADRDLLIRAALAGMPDAPVSRVLYRYRWHSKSLTMNAGDDNLLRGMEDGLTIIQRLKEERNLTVLIVEQNAALVLDIADHGYVMENGRIVLEGPAEELRRNSDIKEFYLGLNEIGTRKSYRDVKHYKRRKRWLS